MQRFIEFLMEDDDIQYTEIGSTRHPGINIQKHNTEIDGKHVYIGFAHMRNTLGHGHYRAYFDVDGNQSVPYKSTKSDHNSGRKILHHVSKVMHHFTGKFKPKGIHMSSSDSNPKSKVRKHRYYLDIANKLAKRYNGHVTTSEEGPHTHIHVHFPHH